MAEPLVQVPLEHKDTGQTREVYVVNKGNASAYMLSKLQLLLIAVVAILLIIIIIILAALLGVERAKSDVKGSPSVEIQRKGGDWPTDNGPTTSGTEAWWNVRLPSMASPRHYDLNLNVDPNKDTFSGEEEILVTVTSSTPYVILHARGLNITEVSLRNAVTKESIKIKRHFNFKKNDYHVTETASPLPPSSYVMKLHFSGAFAKGLFGLFKGSYRTLSGGRGNFAATQLEPVDARSMFPCFDEPALKTTFNITIAHPSNMAAFSNMPIREDVTKGNTRHRHFQKTLKMSTYLVVLSVGVYETAEKTSKNGVKLRVIARPGRKDQMDYALKIANDTLTQLEDFFGIRYPLPKMDLIALPECFIAMENWGLIYFEEDGLLYKKGFSTEEVKQGLLIRWLPHEIAHMWFGNLVTMAWWNDLWLNEAFADYYTYHEAAPISNKDWKMNVQFVYTNVGYALEMDGYTNSRSVVETTPLPTFDTFDNIVYKKGSSVIRMLVNYIGHDIFTKGIRKYLREHSYGSAKTDDIWNALQSVCPKCIYFKGIMDPWVKTVGFPLVTVMPYGTAPVKYIVKQERFLYDKDASVTPTYWIIPFTYISGAISSVTPPSTNESLWIKSKPGELFDIKWNGSGWIKGNFGQTGFYRVNYPASNWDNLAAQLQHHPTVFSEVDRYGLIDDSFNLARGHRLNITKALAITAYIDKENEFVPWKGVEINLNYIKRILKPGSHTYNHLKRYLAFQSKTLYDKLGFKDEGKHLDKLQRLMVVHFHCEARIKSCLQNMTEMFNAWKKDPLTSKVTPVLRKLVYYYGVAHGSPEDWDLVYRRTHTSIIASEMQPLLFGLAGSRDTWMLNKYLDIMTDQTKIKKQYAKYVLDFVANENPIGVNVAWSFLRGNWEKLKNMNGGVVPAMITYIPTITKRFSTQYQLEQLTEFVKEKLDGQPAPRKVKMAMELVKLNVQWRVEHEKDLENWLKDFLAKQNVPSSEKAGFGGFSEPA